MPTEAPNPERVLSTLAGSRFSFEKILGTGGMGEVCLATDTHLHRLVAIKTIRRELSTNDLVRKRIEREYLMHARVGPHPNIVTLFDMMEIGDVICLVMEYVEGEVLQDRLSTNEMLGRNMPLSEAITIAAQSLDALMRIHQHGIVHRDIKPANIMLCWDDSRGLCAKLMDFGISFISETDTDLSRLTNLSGVGPGTPLYMAPEQIDSRRFGPVSRATDLYATGVLLYEMLTGAPPYGGTFTEIFNGHVNSPLPPLMAHGNIAVIAEINGILQKALAKEPADRFSTAQEFRDHLLGFLAVPGNRELVIERSAAAPSRARGPIHELPTRDANEPTPYISPTYLDPLKRVKGMPTFLSTMHGRRGLTVTIILLVLLIPILTVWALKSFILSATPSAPPPTVAAARHVPAAAATPSTASDEILITSQPDEPVSGLPVVESAPPAPPPLLAWPPLPAEDMPALPAPDDGLMLAAAVPDPAGLGGVPLVEGQQPIGVIEAASISAGEGTLQTTQIPPPPGMESDTGTQAAVVTGLAPITAVFRQPHQATYVVQRGDTLSGIAARLGFTKEQIAEWNGLTHPYFLQVNQPLYLNEQPNRVQRPVSAPRAPQRSLRVAPSPPPKTKAPVQSRKGRHLMRSGE